MRDTVDGINEKAWERAMRKPIEFQRTHELLMDDIQAGRVEHAATHARWLARLVTDRRRYEGTGHGDSLDARLVAFRQATGGTK